MSLLEIYIILASQYMTYLFLSCWTKKVQGKLGERSYGPLAKITQWFRLIVFVNYEIVLNE